MPKVKLDTGIQLEHKNRFVRFVPTLSTGNLITAASVIIASTLAWAQMRSDISIAIKANEALGKENEARKQEILATSEKQDKDKAELYRKISDSQQVMHGEIKDLGTILASRFDRLEDKLDRKADKHP